MPAPKLDTMIFPVASEFNVDGPPVNPLTLYEVEADKPDKVTEPFVALHNVGSTLDNEKVGFGQTVTATEKVEPAHVPDLGVTVYVAVPHKAVELFSV